MAAINSLNPMTVLSDAQLERIREASEDIIETTGVCVRHEGLLKRAARAGAEVNEAAGRVRIPAPLLRELLARAPSRYTMRGVTGDEWEAGGERQHTLAIVTDPWIIDYATQRPRRPCLEDVRRHTIIAQKLPSVAAISRMDFPVTDFDDATSSLRALEAHLLNHARHYVVLAATLGSFGQWMEIGRILAQGGDIGGLMTSGIAVVSPLTIDELNAELLVRSVERGLVIVPTVCPMAGATAPYSLASSLLQANVEVLAVAALTQMLRPGTPFQYAMGLSVADMRTGRDLYYTMDKVLWKIAGVQLGLSYGLPTSAECGGSLTYRYDQQSGAEGMLFMLAAHASRAHMLAGIGSNHNANGMSAEMMVIQDAYLRAARFLSRGINTDDVHLGVESVKKAGPGGNFMTDDLTIDLLRTGEFFQDDVFDFAGGYQEGKSMLERAHERVEELVAGYVSPVPDQMQEDLIRYFHDLYVSMGAT